MPSAARRCIARVHNELLVEPAKPYEKAAAFSRGVRLKTTVLTTVLTGRPTDSIAGYAPTERFDLIVMGTHGRTGLSHALLGSVAECVVRNAPCPVMIVRETTPQQQEKPRAAARSRRTPLIVGLQGLTGSGVGG